MLLKAKLLYRGVCHYEDDKWTVSKGIGINNNYLSAYIIPNELRLKVEEIRATDEDQKQRIAAEKELFGVDTPKQEGQQEPAEPEQPLEIGHYKKYILIIKDNFGSGAKFRELKRKFREANNLWLDTFKKYGNSVQSREAEAEIENIKQDLLNLLLSFNVQRKALPKDGETMSLFLGELLTK